MKAIPNDPREVFVPEDELPEPELLDEDEDLLLANGRRVCPDCGCVGSCECF